MALGEMSVPNVRPMQVFHVLTGESQRQGLNKSQEETPFLLPNPNRTRAEIQQLLCRPGVSPTVRRSSQAFCSLTRPSCPGQRCVHYARRCSLCVWGGAGDDPRDGAETRVLAGLALGGSVPSSGIHFSMCPVRRLTSTGPLHSAPTFCNLLVSAEGSAGM